MSSASSVDSEVMMKRATEFIYHLSDRYRSYHDHKESMAYAGAALYIAAFVSAFVAKDWPPKWGAATTPLTVGAITIAWLAMLNYLRFQLRRRRWAALRVAGIEKLIAKWVSEPPTADDLLTWVPDANARVCLFDKLIDYVWPLQGTVQIVDRTEAVYPRALVRSWLIATEQGTEALIHERIVILIVSLLFVALMVRTLSIAV